MQLVEFRVALCGLALTVALLIASGARAESPAVEISLTPYQAREDLELSISVVEAGLPDIYWHQSRHAWNRAKLEARRAAALVNDTPHLYAIIRALMSRIGEGHLSLQRSNALIQQEHERGSFLPLDLHFSSDGIFVIRGYGDAADIQPGARLLSINGEGYAALVHEIMTARGTDGKIPTEAMRAASGKGYAAFRYRLRGAEATYDIRLTRIDGSVTRRTVAAIPYSTRPAPVSNERSPLPTLEWLDPTTAYLTAPTFSNKQYREAGADYASTMQDIFTRLDQGGAKDLILDLRDNGGGSEPNESILFSYLVAKPLRKYAAVEARGRTVSAMSLSGKRFTWEVYDSDELSRQRLGPHGRLLRRNIPPDGLMTHWAPRRPVYKGRLVVLAGGNTFSGAAELTSMLFHTRRAVFVGEETGGADIGNTSGYKWRVTLPNSGLQLGVPLLQFRFNWRPQHQERGVFPDCPAPPLLSEIGDKHDRAWRTAVAILQEHWTRPSAAQCPKQTGAGAS